jgi:hypothetical protein
VAGRSIACGDDVALALDGDAVARSAPGAKFVRRRGNRCVFAEKTENASTRLKLGLDKGTWNARIVGRDLEPLTNPVDVGVELGDDAGSESLSFRETRAVWKYARKAGRAGGRLRQSASGR